MVFLKIAKLKATSFQAGKLNLPAFKRLKTFFIKE
ncbi:hypothetical protein GGQ92_001875 [Gracilibacillus halotolerans]|uniref:Uncharacterized protein n=1 Tax=Gracilibacillus halotolerans TaxID=74386 RepID=A0A841RPI5_9BACI|nr:hypothetical protein [Gracilibacillus halotolerans]